MNLLCVRWDSASAGWDLEPGGHAPRRRARRSRRRGASQPNESSSIAEAKRIVRAGRGMPVAGRAMTASAKRAIAGSGTAAGYLRRGPWRGPG